MKLSVRRTKLNKYTVIRDSQEQHGLYWEPGLNCEGMIIRKLKTGDYTIIGYEDSVCCERKGCVSEFATNIHEDRFQRCVERMQHYQLKLLIFDFDMDEMIDFPEKSDLPKSVKAKIKVTGKEMIKKLNDYTLDYGIYPVFCGSKYGSFVYLSSLFKRLVERCKNPSLLREI